jgi:DNA modification methylase
MIRLPDERKTLRLLFEQLANPTIARSDARVCDPSERRESILRSLFAGFVFSAFPIELMHKHLNAESRVEYFSDFYDHLIRYYPGILHRNCALVFLVVREQDIGYPNLRDSLYAFVEEQYRALSNHCYFGILIKQSAEGDEAGQWRLFSDLVLYAEKFRQTKLNTGYFQSKTIEAITRAHIPNLSSTEARFDLANEGFFFRDALVLAHDANLEDPSNYDILLIFEKNERDERTIPCPACRSLDVRGNSYPVLGVKSWECQNVLCPERSAFDRGNRFSLSSLIKQRAISSTEDQIPVSSLRRWRLDMVPGVREHDVVDMLIRHFSLHGDTALFVNSGHYGQDFLGRRIKYRSFSIEPGQQYASFQNSPLFARFLAQRSSKTDSWKVIPSSVDGVQVYCGDAFDVLSSLQSCSIDGAVTSPPYYNARSYSVWPNVYCYLYDMYNVARQVYRVLRPGAYFLFNIFDYFDNENTVVLSSMGKKRMILGAYIINAFRRIGFRIEGNTVWYKGEIEGKRNFNQGNRSPYYQFPLNCWEHVLIFRKPGDNQRQAFPRILSARPVVKIVKGENILGHSAPFPSSIPELLISRMERDEHVLDPFSGTMMTARVARKFGLKSTSIDLHEEYCRLGLDLLGREEESDGLFRSVA